MEKLMAYLDMEVMDIFYGFLYLIGFLITMGAIVIYFQNKEKIKREKERLGKEIHDKVLYLKQETQKRYQHNLKPINQTNTNRNNDTVQDDSLLNPLNTIIIASALSSSNDEERINKTSSSSDFGSYFSSSSSDYSSSSSNDSSYSSSSDCSSSSDSGSCGGGD